MYIDPSTGLPGTNTPDWLKNMPAFPAQQPAQGEQGNWLTAGLSSGFHGALADIGSAGEAVAKAAGWSSGSEAAKQWATSQQQSAQAASRPDLEANPWSAAGIGYHLAQAVPGLAGMIGAGALVPEAAVPAALARFGEAVPAVLGGGEAFGKTFLGAFGAGLPLSIGANVQQEEQGGAPLTQGGAAEAIGLGVPEAAVGGFFPAQAKGGAALGAPTMAVQSGTQAGLMLAKKILGGAALGAPTMAVQSGIQAGLTGLLDPDPNKTFGDRARDVVNAALQGGVMGGLFGGAFGAFHGAAQDPNLKNAPTNDIKTAVDAGLGIQTPTQPGQQGEMFGAPEQGPARPQSPFSTLSNTDLQAQVQDLAAKPSRTPEEDLQHSLLQQELNARTPPGEAPGQGTLFTPEEMGARVPQISAMKDQALQLAQTKGANPEASDFFKNFNAANEPELVNALQQEVENTPAKSMPAWLTKLGNEMGVLDGKKPSDPDTMLVDQQNKLDELDAQRQKAAQTGDTATFQKANADYKTVSAKIDKLTRLSDVHAAAAELRNPTPEPIAGEGGQLNLPGMGEAKPTEAAPAAEPPAGQNPAQPSLFTPEELGDRKVAVTQFQNELLSKMPARVARGSEADVRGLDAANEPELVNELRTIVANPDHEPSTGVQLLAEHYGLVDENGRPTTPESIQSAVDDAHAEVQKAWDDAAATNLPGKRDQLVREAQALAGPDGKLAKLQATQDLHAQADQIDRAPAVVPDRVRPSLADHWQQLQELKASDDPKLAEKADNAQKAIEQNNPRAKAIADNVLKQNTRVSTSKKMVSNEEENARTIKRLALKEAFKSGVSRPAPAPEAPLPGDEHLGLAREAAQNVADTVLPARLANGEVRKPPFTNRVAFRPEDVADLERISRKLPQGTEYKERAVAALKGLRDKPDSLAAREVARNVLNALDAHIKMQEEAGHVELPEKYKATPKSMAAMTFEERMAAIKERPTAVNTPLSAAPKERAVPSGVNEWVERNRGDITFHDDDHGLIRQTPGHGNTVFLPFDMKSGSIALSDVSSSKVPWLTPDVKAKLLASKNATLNSDRIAAEKNPDGPFNGKGGQVVGTPSADPRLVKYVSELAKAVGLGDMRILITHPDDVVGKAGDTNQLHGEYASARSSGMSSTEQGHVRPFGPNSKDAYIFVKPGMSDALSVETASHEVGHVVEYAALRNAPKQTQAAITQAYANWYKQATGMGQKEFAEMLRNRETSQVLADTLADKPMQSLQYSNRGFYNYLTGFQEWFADNVSRWATSQDKPLSLVEKFFSQVGQKMRQLVNAITGNKFAPDAVVKDFLDRLQPDAANAWLADTSKPKIPFVTEASSKVQSTPAESDNNLHDYVQTQGPRTLQMATDVLSRAADAKTNIGNKLQQGALYVMSTPGIVRIMGKYLPAAQRHWEATQQRGAVTSLLNKPLDLALKTMHAMKPEHQAIAQNLMRATGEGVDYRKSFAQQPELHNKPNADRLKLLADASFKDWNRLRQMDGGAPARALETGRQAMETLRLHELAAQFYSRIDSAYLRQGKNIPGFETNPFKEYQFRNDLHDDPALANGFWRDTLTKMQNGVNAIVQGADSEAAQYKKTDPKKFQAIRSQVADMRDIKNLIDAGVKQTQGVPYFPFRRGGDHFVAGKLAVDDRGVPKPEATAALTAALEKAGFDNVGVFSDPTSPTVFARTETPAKMERLAKVFSDMQAAGHLDANEAIKRGYPDQLDTLHGIAPQYVKRQIEHMKSMMPEIPDGMSTVDATKLKEAHNAILRGQTQQWLDMLSDNSLIKSLQPREGVSGYDKDMIKSMAQRAHSGTMASSGMAMGGDVADAAAEMHKQVQAAKADPNQNPLAVQNVANELMIREAQSQMIVSNKFLDGLQAGMHSIVIGFNPAYTITATSQVPLLLHPELAKTHGFAKAGVAIGNATGRAITALRAGLADEFGRVGFREEQLKKYGVSAKDIETIMRLDNAGALSNNTFTRSITDMAEGTDPTQVNWKEAMNVMGTAAEMLPRLIGALSARDLYEAKQPANFKGDVHDFVKQVVNNSQFEWGGGASSRLTSKMGFLGPYSKIAFAFTQFQTRMIEKLYEEVHNAIAGDTPQQRMEAGKFLVSHLVASIAIAGTLGLPAAGWLSGAADKIGTALTGDDDINVEASYRTWLASVFGKDAGDAIASGLPTLAGFDFSHLGDANLVPGTRLMQEKRKFEDSEKDWLKSMAGSLPGELANIYLGGRDMMNGDYSLGATKMLPEGFKGLAEAFRMSEYGYIDKNGTKLPIQPKGLDILKAALGLDPRNMKQYEEANEVVQGAMAQRQYREQNITRHLSLALSQHDPAALRSWMSQAIQFQLQHPGVMNPTGRIVTDEQKHIMQQGYARAQGMPLGVKPLDVSLQSRLGFLNTGGQ